MNIVFFGTSSFGLPSLEALVKSRHALKAVVSTPDKPQGRSLKVQASPVKEWALKNGVAYFDFVKEQPSQTLQALKEFNSDVFVVISFGVILKKDALEIPRLMPINIHASLLPKYRGASPMQAAILNQDESTGVTAMRMVERLDAGDILLRKELSLSLKDDILILEKRLSALSAETTLEALDVLESGRKEFAPQDEKQATYAQKIAKEDGRIDWSQGAGRIDAKVRAYLGWPGTHFFFRGKRIVLCKTQPEEPARSGAAPGSVLTASEAEGLVVTAGERTALRLEALQLEGRKALGWKEFLRGFPLKTGELLE